MLESKLRYQTFLLRRQLDAVFGIDSGLLVQVTVIPLEIQNCKQTRGALVFQW